MNKQIELPTRRKKSRMGYERTFSGPPPAPMSPTSLEEMQFNLRTASDLVEKVRDSLREIKHPEAAEQCFLLHRCQRVNELVSHNLERICK